ncbi:MAG: F0F1 ATP synthase subunit A [Bacteroidetes bacterium]|nr:F0F1 ATP synthase subunit A [Bacteroidota bacterium]
MISLRKYCIALIFSGLSVYAFAQHGSDHQEPHTEATQHPTEQAPAEGAHEAEHGVSGGDMHAECPCGAHEESEVFNAGDNAVHHIADANAIHVIGDIYVHLPVMLYAPGHGWTITTTAAFKPEHHGNGAIAKDGYVLVHGSIMRIQDPSFPAGEVALQCDPSHEVVTTTDGKEKTVYKVGANNTCYHLDPKSTVDGGMMGGGITSFYDFSITRNVFTMLLTAILLFWLFLKVARSAAGNQGKAPRGLQNFIEPLYTFIRDEVAKPNIGRNYERYMPYLLSAFFFILGLNLIGQIPFFPGSANVTGNISVTIVLALITFFISTFSANRHFWEHTLWMPGVPALLKILVLTPVEILGLFLKPFTLLLRLFANITAGHIVILSFVSLIFIFGDAGKSVGGSITGILASVPLTLFMMALELLVAFLQAFIFTMLSAVYIGTAIEDPHPHGDHH